ncbi:MAG: DUF3892 domain-containing protein [Opitutus sp.]|nr:DUF3892 domain-containing protein [Opitutus sp.]
MALPLHRRAVSFVQKAYSYDPHERIDSIGGVNSDKSRWKLSQEEAISAIESGRTEFYVAAHDRILKVVVVKFAGQKYLKTETDEKSPDGLLTLPSS